MKLLYFLNSKPLKHRILHFLAIFLSASCFSQKIVHDWENYVVSLNGRPVSINVDLGFAAIAPVKEDSFVIILRVKLNEPDANGMPFSSEEQRLILMEDGMVELLARQSGASFAGRFTQRGIREFYFYAPDTIGFRRAVNQAMQPFSGHEWLSQAKKDGRWENYFSVLYPGKIDMLRIQSRRNIELIARTTSLKNRPMALDYFFRFQNADRRTYFLRSPEINGFEIIDLPDKNRDGSQGLEMTLRRKDIPDFPWIETHIVPMFYLAQKKGGEFLGWQKQ